VEAVEAVIRGARQIAKVKAKERAESNLMEFCEYLWPVVEPAIPFVRGWAIGAIAEHLQAVTEGQITRLLMNVPPGFTKSLMTDVFWPAWEWGPRNMPWLRYVCASYSSHLTERDNMRCRNVVTSNLYKDAWGDRFQISNEQFTKIKFANNKTGWKLATSVSGIGVGERGDRFIIDDPNNTMDMESEAVRHTTNLWFTEVVPDRLNNPEKSAIVIIQQRLHEDDISGTALSREMGYTHLMIPVRHDTTRHCTTYFPKTQEPLWEDPRIEDGELAWPERFTDKVCDDLERDKGPYAWAGQYMQSPAPRGGAILKDEWWQVWPPEGYPPTSIFPTFEYMLASLDTAYTEKEENDPSALTVWGMWRDDFGNPKIMLVYAWTERLQFNELVDRVTDNCIRPSVSGRPNYPVDKLLIEAKGAGMSVAHELHRLWRGTGKLGIELIDPKKCGDKVARLTSIQHLFSDGMVYAPDFKWADAVIRQCSVFPKGSHDDLVDSTAQALRYLRDMGFALRREEASLVAAEELAYDNRMAIRPLYET